MKELDPLTAMSKDWKSSMNKQRKMHVAYLRRQAIQLTQPAQVIKMNQDKKRRA